MNEWMNEWYTPKTHKFEIVLRLFHAQLRFHPGYSRAVTWGAICGQISERVSQLTLHSMYCLKMKSDKQRSVFD